MVILLFGYQNYGDVDYPQLVNHTSWMALAPPIDHPKSVSNCFVIDVFGDDFL